MRLIRYKALVFLSLYVSTASTSPTAITPNSNSSALLQSRVVPENNYCEQEGFTWVKRECVISVFLAMWRDVCDNGDHYYGACTGLTPLCQNYVDLNLDHNIKCVSLLEQARALIRKRKSDPIIGMSAKRRATSKPGGTQFNYGVEIEDDMVASATASFLSSDESFAIEPQNVIVGKIRGKEITVCQGSYFDAEVTARTCYPNGRYSLYKGDFIDYSWGLSSDQEGMLSYGIHPSSLSL